MRNGQREDEEEDGSEEEEKIIRMIGDCPWKRGSGQHCQELNQGKCFAKLFYFSVRQILHHRSTAS